MKVTFTNPTIYDVRPDLVPLPKITTQTVQSLNKFFGQPDDGLHTGQKHVVVYYIIIIIMFLKG